MKNKMNPDRKHANELIDNLIKEISPKEQRTSDRKMQLAARIDIAMKSSGLTKSQFAKAMRKNPSEITKWLSGTHNFTTETLWEIGDVLGIELVNIEESNTEQVVYKTFIVVSQETKSAPWNSFASNALPPINKKRKLNFTYTNC